jgi:16S rRNA (uracil1498-N3)-methyltransferase
MRLKRGDEIAVFNGRDGEWRAAIEGFGRGWCSLDLRERSRAQTAVPDLWLLFAPIKRARVDFIAEKATELGAAELMPVITRYTAIRRVNTQRLRANAIEAAEQCGRLSVPEVHEPEALEAWLARWPPERRLLFCDESGAGAEPAAALARAEPGPWAILIGPEGGFDEAERRMIRELPGACAISLGPRTLRAETAAMVALGLWQSYLGDWRETGGDMADS